MEKIFNLSKPKQQNFFTFIFFLETEKLILFFLKNEVTCCANKIYKITYPWGLN